MPKQPFKSLSLLHESIEIIKKDPSQFESLLKLSNTKIYKKLLSQESAKNTKYWVDYLNKNQLLFINQPNEIRLNKKINMYINIDILLWKEYILNNPLDYHKLPSKIIKNSIIIKNASYNKKIWINHINNIDKYIKAPILIKLIPEIVINNIKCINTFNIFYNKIPKILKENKDILLKIITIDPNSINIIFNYNLTYNKLLNDNNFLMSAINININIINNILYKWKDQTFIILILNYLIQNNNINENNIYIKEIINYLINNNIKLSKIINNEELKLYNRNIIYDELIIDDDNLDITIIISNNLNIFDYLPDKLKLCIPFLYNLIKKNCNIILNISKYLSTFSISDISKYLYDLTLNVKPVYTFKYIYNKQIQYLLFNSISINPLTYNIFHHFTKNNIISYKLLTKIMYKNPTFLFSNRSTDIIVNDFKKNIINYNFDNTLLIWEIYGINKLKIEYIKLGNKLKEFINIYKNKILDYKLTNNSDINNFLLNWNLKDYITNIISFSINRDNDDKYIKIINNINEINKIIILNHNTNSLFDCVNNLICTRNKIYFISNIMDNLKISETMLHFILATHKGFILPHSNRASSNKIELCPELIKIICSFLIKDNNIIDILINSNHINKDFNYIENIIS